MLFVYLVVIFIKQKTANEMRISDWSSDVCSSDLQNFRLSWLSKNGPSHQFCGGWLESSGKLSDERRVRSCNAVTQRRRGMPSQRPQPIGRHQLARRAVRFAGIQHDLAFKSHHVLHRFGKPQDCDIVTITDIPIIQLGIAPCRENGTQYV